MSKKLIRCVEIKGNRVKFLPESIARNPIRMRQIGFMVQEIDEPVFEPTKPFPVVEKIVEPIGEAEPTPEPTSKPKRTRTKKS
jgi:hypothetical protein